MEGMKTLDVRCYREVIKAAVARERQADPNWSWGIRSISKGVARIGWGYLDYIGEKETFTVEVLGQVQRSPGPENPHQVSFCRCSSASPRAK